MQMNFTTSQFPVGKNRYIQGYDMVTEMGAFYFMITPLFAFLFIQGEIVREKEYRLRQGTSTIIQDLMFSEPAMELIGFPGLLSLIFTQ